MMRDYLLLGVNIVLAMSLAGCETVPSDFRVVCPPVRIYSKGFQSQVLRELDALPDSSALRVVTRDYLELRDSLRDCHAPLNR